MDSLNDGDQAGHVIEKSEVAELTTELALRAAKDPMPLKEVGQQLGALAKRVVATGKELHVLLAGCNTIGVVTELHAACPPDCKQKVWVVCTNEVFPSDLAPFLWHHYGTTVQPGDLDGYRVATRRLLGEYTEHYKRQRIEDEAIREARKGAGSGGLEDSIANAARCDRLDRVTLRDGGRADVALL